jgi:hypothetical protein
MSVLTRACSNLPEMERPAEEEAPFENTQVVLKQVNI